MELRFISCSPRGGHTGLWTLIMFLSLFLLGIQPEVRGEMKLEGRKVFANTNKSESESPPGLLIAPELSSHVSTLRGRRSLWAHYGRNKIAPSIDLFYHKHSRKSLIPNSFIKISSQRPAFNHEQVTEVRWPPEEDEMEEARPRKSSLRRVATQEDDLEIGETRQVDNIIQKEFNVNVRVPQKSTFSPNPEKRSWRLDMGERRSRRIIPKPGQLRLLTPDELQKQRNNRKKWRSRRIGYLGPQRYPSESAPMFYNPPDRSPPRERPWRWYRKRPHGHGPPPPPMRGHPGYGRRQKVYPSEAIRSERRRPPPWRHHPGYPPPPMHLPPGHGHYTSPTNNLPVHPLGNPLDGDKPRYSYPKEATNIQDIIEYFEELDDGKEGDLLGRSGKAFFKSKSSDQSPSEEETTGQPMKTLLSKDEAPQDILKEGIPEEDEYESKLEPENPEEDPPQKVQKKPYDLVFETNKFLRRRDWLEKLALKRKSREKS